MKKKTRETSYVLLINTSGLRSSQRAFYKVNFVTEIIIIIDIIPVERRTVYIEENDREPERRDKIKGFISRTDFGFS